MVESSFGDGYSEGKAEGMVEGMDKVTKDIALKLVKTGATVDTIAEVTDLKLTEIKCLLQKGKDKTSDIVITPESFDRLDVLVVCKYGKKH